MVPYLCSLSEFSLGCMKIPSEIISNFFLLISYSFSFKNRTCFLHFAKACDALQIGHALSLVHERGVFGFFALKLIKFLISDVFFIIFFTHLCFRCQKTRWKTRRRRNGLREISKNGKPILNRRWSSTPRGRNGTLIRSDLKKRRRNWKKSKKIVFKRCSILLIFIKNKFRKIIL